MTREKAFEILDVEEPLQYAKIKGDDNPLYNGTERFWNYNYMLNRVFQAGKSETDTIKTQFTKSEWAELGITDENADFERVEE